MVTTIAGGHESGSMIRPEKPSAASLWSLFLGLGLLMIGNGLNGAVIDVRSGNAGFSVVTGVIMAGYFALFLLAPSFVSVVHGGTGSRWSARAPRDVPIARLRG